MYTYTHTLTSVPSPFDLVVFSNVFGGGRLGVIMGGWVLLVTVLDTGVQVVTGVAGGSLACGVPKAGPDCSE